MSIRRLRPGAVLEALVEAKPTLAQVRATTPTVSRKPRLNSSSLAVRLVVPEAQGCGARLGTVRAVQLPPLEPRWVSMRKTNLIRMHVGRAK